MIDGISWIFIGAEYLACRILSGETMSQTDEA